MPTELPPPAGIRRVKLAPAVIVPAPAAPTQMMTELDRDGVTVADASAVPLPVPDWTCATTSGSVAKMPLSEWCSRSSSRRNVVAAENVTVTVLVLARAALLKQRHCCTE
jgi:hypothetical protein